MHSKIYIDLGLFGLKHYGNWNAGDFHTDPGFHPIPQRRGIPTYKIFPPTPFVFKRPNKKSKLFFIICHFKISKLGGVLRKAHQPRTRKLRGPQARLYQGGDTGESYLISPMGMRVNDQLSTMVFSGGQISSIFSE